MTQWLTTTAVMCALVLASTHAAPGTTGTTATDTQAAAQKGKTEGNAAERFMREAAMSGMAEVVHGKQAQSNASNQEVRAFGQRMVDDHSKANEELKALAAKKEANLPAELDQKHQAMQQKLEKMKGEEFDRAYMQHMVQAHKEAVTLFQTEAKSSKDADTRAWAAKTLPVLQEHLKMATAINAKLGKGGR